MTDDEVRAYITSVRWQFAKTMPWNPHEYTVRGWGPEEQFEAFVLHIRAAGFEQPYKGKSYLGLVVDGHYYWTMGNPLEMTKVINRKVN